MRWYMKMKRFVWNMCYGKPSKQASHGCFITKAAPFLHFEHQDPTYDLIWKLKDQSSAQKIKASFYLRQSYYESFWLFLLSTLCEFRFQTKLSLLNKAKQNSILEWTKKRHKSWDSNPYYLQIEPPSALNT